MTSPEERPEERESDLLAKLFDIRSFTDATGWQPAPFRVTAADVGQAPGG